MWGWRWVESVIKNYSNWTTDCVYNSRMWLWSEWSLISSEEGHLRFWLRFSSFAVYIVDFRQICCVLRTVNMNTPLRSFLPFFLSFFLAASLVDRMRTAKQWYWRNWLICCLDCPHYQQNFKHDRQRENERKDLSDLLLFTVYCSVSEAGGSA